MVDNYGNSILNPLVEYLMKNTGRSYDWSFPETETIDTLFLKGLEESARPEKFDWNQLIGVLNNWRKSRYWFTKELIKIDANRAVMEIIDSVERDSFRLGEVVAALSNAGKPAVKPLIAFLQRQKYSNYTANLDTLETAIEALGNIGDPAAVEVLVDAMDCTSPCNISAEKALVKIGTPAIGCLKKALENKDLNFPERFVEVLERIGVKSDELQKIKREAEGKKIIFAITSGLFRRSGSFFIGNEIVVEEFFRNFVEFAKTNT